MRRLVPLVVTACALLLAASPAAAQRHTYTYYSKNLSLAGYQVLFGRDAQHSHQKGSIVGMSTRIVDSRGRYVPPWRVMLHHIVYSKARTRDGVCRRLHGERFFGTGEEDRPLQLPHGYGYPIRRKDAWHASWMIMSHHAQPDRVRIQTTVTVDDNPRIVPVRPYWVGITGCQPDPIFNVPGGAGEGSNFTTTSKDWTVPRDGRIVAVMNHLHGGARTMSVKQPGCGDRTLFDSHATYGTPAHPLYQVNPLVHEPGPLSTTSQRTATGIPVRKGTKLRVSTDYDGAWLHTRVMAITHIYMASAKAKPPPCAPLPKDIVSSDDNRLVRPGVPTTQEPPHVLVPLARMGPDGLAHDIDQVPQPSVPLGGSPFLNIEHFSFLQPNITVPRDTLLTWGFHDATAHDVTVTAGPRGFASVTSRRRARYSVRVTEPGTYSLLCTRHPLTMQQTIVVR